MSHTETPVLDVVDHARALGKNLARMKESSESMIASVKATDVRFVEPIVAIIALLRGALHMQIQTLDVLEQELLEAARKARD